MIWSLRFLLRAIDIHVLRDPTRGGVTSALTEIAQTAKVGMLLDEARIPISEEVKGACEILGLDPLYVANEGKLMAIVCPCRCRDVSSLPCNSPVRQRSGGHRRSDRRYIPASL